jgi:hypothetical protein
MCAGLIVIILKYMFIVLVFDIFNDWTSTENQLQAVLNPNSND